MTREKECASDEDMYSDDEPIMPGPPPSQDPVDYEDADESFDAWLHCCPSRFAPIQDHDAYWNDLYRRGH